MQLTELRKKILAALMLAFVAAAFLPACSSSEEESSSGECDESMDNYEECIRDLPI